LKDICIESSVDIFLHIARVNKHRSFHRWQSICLRKQKISLPPHRKRGLGRVLDSKQLLWFATFVH